MNFLRKSFFFLLFSFPVFGVEVPQPEFCLFEGSFIHECVAPFEEQRVAIRGFLYREEGGGYVLAAKPNVPPCCLGKAHMQNQQIRVRDLDYFPSKKRVVTVVGEVKKIQSEPDLLYCLTDAHCKPLPNRHALPILTFLTASFFLLFFLIQRAKKGVSPKKAHLEKETEGETSVL